MSGCKGVRRVTKGHPGGPRPSALVVRSVRVTVCRTFWFFEESTTLGTELSAGFTARVRLHD